MPVWEYRQIDLNDLPLKTEEVDVLNELGQQVWELVVWGIASIGVEN